MTNATKQTWLFNWYGGGYNTVQASSKREAIKLAKALAKGTVLVLDEASLKVATPEMVDEKERQYAGMFD